jgi:hypothetical protein
LIGLRQKWPQRQHGNLKESRRKGQNKKVPVLLPFARLDATTEFGKLWVKFSKHH